MGQVLRHRSHLTTAVYAKVDVDSLRTSPVLAGGCGMSELRQSLGDYLTIRRSLGFKLARTGLLLADFVDYAERGGADIITTELAFSWATLPAGAPSWVGSATRSGARVRPASPRHRSRPRGPADRPDRRQEPASDPLSLLSRRHRRSDDGRRVVPLPPAGLHLRDPRRLAGGNRHAGRRSTRARPRRHRLGQRARSHHRHQISARAAWSPCTRARSTRSLPMAIDVIQLCARPRDPSFFVSTAGTRLLYCNLHGPHAVASDAPGSSAFLQGVGRAHMTFGTASLSTP